MPMKRWKERVMRPYVPRGIVTVCLVWLLLERPVQAYLDPGSGSMFLQLLLGGVAGLGVILKLYWHRVTRWFGARPPGEGDDGRNPQ